MVDVAMAPGHAGVTAELVAARAGSDPERVALAVDGGEDLTYGDWDRVSNAVARGLADRGVGAGDRVALLFDGRHWADFATAHLGVMKAGGVAVLLSPGAARPDLERAVAHAGATGLLCPPHLVPPTLTTWAAHPGAVARGRDTASVAGGVLGAAPAALAELVYPLAPLAPARPRARCHAELGEGLDVGPGWIVHAWAPGSLPGQRAVRLAAAGPARVAALAAFDPERLCRVAAARRAVACGLTPALAAALVASGAAARHDVASVALALLSGPCTLGLRAGLRAAFPGADIVELDGASSPATAGSAEPAPVAVSQEGMLWHEQFAPGSFNVPCLVRRHQGPLDVAAMQGALSELVRRHQPLRSVFELIDGEVRQVVAAHHGLTLPVVDLSALPPDDREARAARLLADATSRPFDLATGPLFEPRLVRLGPDDHLLVVRLHHTVFDDWSVDVFRRELSALYAAGVAGARSPLMEPPVTFTDVCRRERARAAGDGGAARSWWRRELAGAPLAVQIPASDDGRPEGVPDGEEALRVDLGPSLAAALRSLAPRLRATPFMTVLAAFSVLLARATGQDDLLMATVVARRDRSDVEPLVGCFTKKVPLRLRLHGDPTFPELVARTRTSLVGALSHQEVAFDAAVHDALGGPAADHGVVPHVAVVFQAETPQQVQLALPGLATSPYETGAEARRERHFSSGRGDTRAWGDGIYAGTFLIVSLLDHGDGMALVARGVFHRPTARCLLEDFRRLLADVVAGPSRPVSALDAGEPVVVPDGVVDVRGFRARRSRLEAALGRCPGVAGVAVTVVDDAGDDVGGPRLVASVVAGDGPPPTLPQLRHALWAELPGALWPALLEVVDGAGPPPTGAAPQSDPAAATGLLDAMWGEIRGRPAGPDLSYWQDFSFLAVLAEARAAGLVVPDEAVVRCRTPRVLAAALAARPADVGAP